MKIKEVQINRFKRFTDLKIIDIPETAKLVVLVGPNGSGKTSLLEAFNHWHLYRGLGIQLQDSKDYLEKNEGKKSHSTGWNSMMVQVWFHGHDELQYNQEYIKGKFYFRTAYRNEPDFIVNSLNKQRNPTTYVRLKNLSKNDQVVSENYQRVMAKTIAEVFEEKNDEKSVKELREDIVKKIRKALSNIFEDLSLNSLGDFSSDGNFYFNKGITKRFHYKNLSAGEKSAFDLVLDMIVKSDFYPDAIFCIDEPEAHMHTRLQSKVLRELYNLTPNNSQLWISTHSIGMLKEAEEIEEKNPGSVVFLDFDNRDFDLAQTIKPTKISRAIWERFFDLALADFSNLISPQTIVFCEGSAECGKHKNFDASIYEKILGEKYHDTIFKSIGSCSEIENSKNQSINVISQILKSSKIIKFIDRDDRTDEEVDALLKKGIRTSSRRHIEHYLLDDEIIHKLCVQQGKEKLFGECLKAKESALQSNKDNNKLSDDIKAASGKIFIKIRSILDIHQGGNNTHAFLRDTMAPLITEETNVYKLIEKDIFGENS